MRRLILTLAVWCLIGCAGPAAKPLQFETYDEFETALNDAVSSDQIDAFWTGIKAAGTMPLIFGSNAVFLHHSNAETVYWGGDWTDWEPEAGTKVADSDLWMTSVELPLDARVLYQILESGGEPMSDPLNPNSLDQVSVVMMPAYEPPDFVAYRDDVPHGTLSRYLTISSEHLGYEVRYRVYTPAQAEEGNKLPTIYVTDGPTFISLAQMPVVLDNLIGDEMIRPIMAVFIDQHETRGGRNRRDSELIENPDYGLFIAEELVPSIEANFPADSSPDARAMMGASYGGYHAAYFGLRHSDLFHLIAIQSPVIPINVNSKLVEDYAAIPRLPLTHIFLSTGTIGDATSDAHDLRDGMATQGYDVRYLETSEGHNFTNWGGQLDDVLICFFAP